jgi:phage terminase small subunit
MAGNSTLNEKQKRFVEEYLVDLNATQAAIRAGYSKRTAHSQGPRLLEHVEVAAAIAEAQKKRSDRTEVTADRVLKELARIGFSDIRDIFDETGNLKRPEDWSDNAAAAVSSVEVVCKSLGEGEVEYVKKIKVWDKNSALEKIGKHLGMFVEKMELAAEVKRIERIIVDSANPDG